MKRLIVVCATLAVVVACQSKKDKLATEIQKVEKTLASQTALEADSNTINLLKLYDNYTEVYTEDALTPDLLYRSAALCANIGKYDEAVAHYNDFAVRFPKDKRAPESLYLCAFVTENNLGDTASAHQYYNKFLANYANHPLSNDAKLAIQNLGLSPEELIKQFETK